VLLPNREGHCVLAVRTDRGPIILDCLHRGFTALSAYTFVKRERSIPPAGWTTTPP
jgi:predicted transglutaminase-like cysteine proteinase